MFPALLCEELRYTSIQYFIAAVITGDRVLTDVVFANKFGMHSILVHPLSYLRDHPVAAIVRLLERGVLLPVLRLLGMKSQHPR